MARPRQFDEKALLDAAVELFWSRGYASTSIADVSEATSVGNGSIYAAYRSKDGLFLRAVAHYCDRLSSGVRQAMAGRSGDLSTSLRDYLELVICDCTAQPGRRGCLMLNSIALVDRIPALRGLVAATNLDIRESVRARLVRDLDGAAPPVDLAALSDHYVALSQGLILRSRIGTDADELRALADDVVRHTSLTLAS